MPTLSYNLIVLLACIALVAGAGVYVTFYQQPAELKRAEKAVKVAELKRAEMASLLVEYAQSKEEAAATTRKWNSRYKLIPDTLTSAAVIGRLNDLTRSGFENFDVSLSGIGQNEDYGSYQLRAVGRGYFTSLYRLIWQLENNRGFYKVRDLNLDHLDLVTTDEETGAKRLQVMVSFGMNITAYFGGPAGASANEGDPMRTASDQGTTPAPLRDVPESVLADRRPTINPFFPVVMENVPPNTRGLVDLNEAEFVSVIGQKAVFKDDEGYRQVGRGEDVYLGQIVEVDPTEGRVVARLNRGGILDEVELFLETGERYRQAIGPAQLQSIE